MAKKKKNLLENNDISLEEAARQFGISLKDLENLMQTRGPDGMRDLNEIHGGLNGLGQKLKTNLISGKYRRRRIEGFCLYLNLFLGLSEDETDLSTRVAAFGRNEIPPKPPKTFFRLMFEAVQDMTLVILIICAVISFGLSFYHPSEDSFEAVLRPSKIIFLSFPFESFSLQKKPMWNGSKVQQLSLLSLLLSLSQHLMIGPKNDNFVVYKRKLNRIKNLMS